MTPSREAAGVERVFIEAQEMPEFVQVGHADLVAKDAGIVVGRIAEVADEEADGGWARLGIGRCIGIGRRVKETQQTNERPVTPQWFVEDRSKFAIDSDD